MESFIKVKSVDGFIVAGSYTDCFSLIVSFILLVILENVEQLERMVVMCEAG